MRTSRLPEGGMNLFQEIKAKRVEATAKGIEIINLSIGQPTGAALLSARNEAARVVMLDEERVHEYQDNTCHYIPDFAKRFVQAHFKDKFLEGADVGYLPIPGIKPMLGLIPLACGAHLEQFKVATTTKPGYSTPADWCGYLQVFQYSLLLNPENGFRFQARDIEPGTALVMTNYPHNPSGQIATREWWQKICAVCGTNNIRLFNDNPYYILSHDPASCALSEVAVNYRDLSWAEAFSASKVIRNGTGWRIGAIVGSKDFVADIMTIKGNTDSGFASPMAAGALDAIENDRENIRNIREIYEKRINLLITILTKHGMRLAVNPGAGFFTLWLRPNYFFGEKVQDAKHFNFQMIERTGVTGVQFDPYIRYAVCDNVEDMADKIEAAFKAAEVSY